MVRLPDTIALATAGAAFTLAANKQHPLIGGIAFGFAICTIASAFFAMRAARPSMFALPGNSPENWLPENWTDYPEDDAARLLQAHREQASTLNNQIRDNLRWSEDAGRNLTRSMDLMVWSVSLWTIAAVIAFIIEG